MGGGLCELDMGGAAGCSGIVEDRDARRLGDSLLEELQALDVEIRRQALDARELAPGRARLANSPCPTPS